MKFPVKAEELRNEIVECATKYPLIKDQRILQLLYILRTVDDELIAEGAIQVFEYDNIVAQEFAGKILEVRDPNTSQTINSILKRCLPTWDKSVEQLPFWLSRCFGVETVYAALVIAEDVCKAEMELSNVKTMKWWLNYNV